MKRRLVVFGDADRLVLRRLAVARRRRKLIPTRRISRAQARGRHLARRRRRPGRAGGTDLEGAHARSADGQEYALRQLLARPGRVALRLRPADAFAAFRRGTRDRLFVRPPSGAAPAAPSGTPGSGAPTAFPPAGSALEVLRPPVG